MSLNEIGATCFGLVIGWITYRTLRRKQGTANLSDIAAVIAAVGGGGVTAIFQQAELFSSYSIGLAGGFFLYFIISLFIAGKQETDRFMGE